MKKRVVILLLIVLSVMLVACSKKELTLPEKVYKEYPTEVDKGIQKLMNHEDYDNQEYDTKVQLMGELLELYKKNNQIKKYNYDGDEMYSFTYANDTLGGVKMKPFDPMLN